MKETLDAIRMQLCEELNGYAQRGINNHKDLDIVKDILSSVKNIYRITEHIDKENMEWEDEEETYRGTSHGRRMYYPRDMYMSYANENMNGNGNGNGNYSMNGQSYSMRPVGEQSYGMAPYYDPYYSERGYYIAPVTDGRYSGNTDMDKKEMVDKLKGMMRNTDNPEMKKAISDCITVMEK